MPVVRRWVTRHAAAHPNDLGQALAAALGVTRAAVAPVLRRLEQAAFVTRVRAGTRPQLPGRMGRAKSYAERLFDFPQVGPLNAAAARLAIVKPAREQGVDIADAAVAAIVSSPIRKHDVEAAGITAIAALDDSFFRVRFDRLTPAEKRYLRAMAERGPGPHRSGDIVKQLQRKVTSLGPTRAQLIDKGMVWSPSHGDTAIRRHGVHGAAVRRVHETHHAGRRLAVVAAVQVSQARALAK